MSEGDSDAAEGLGDGNHTIPPGVGGRPEDDQHEEPRTGLHGIFLCSTAAVPDSGDMSMPEILMTGRMLPIVLQQLDERFTLHRAWEAPDHDALLDDIADRIRGVAAGGGLAVDRRFLDRLPNLEIVANFGVGYDGIDAAHARARGVIVTNTPDVLTEEVADTAFGLLLMTVRDLSASERYLRAGTWRQGAYPLTRGTAAGRTMGILGLGRIGKAIARRAEACGFKIAYHGRNRRPDVAYPYYPTLLELAEAVDTLMVVVPGGASTHHVVDEHVLKALGPDGIVINIGRGSVIDEEALVAALRDGTILSAGLDVYEHEPDVPAELIAMEHVVLLPHVGSASIHTRDAMGQLVVDNLTSWFAGNGPLTPVAETPYPA